MRNNDESHCLDAQLSPFIEKTERSWFHSEGEKKMLSVKTWHVPQQLNTELIRRERLHIAGGFTHPCQLRLFKVADGSSRIL